MRTAGWTTQCQQFQVLETPSWVSRTQAAMSIFTLEHLIFFTLLSTKWAHLNLMPATGKLQRFCKSHHLQCITSSKDSEKLEKSLCIRDKAEDLCWMPVVFGPSDDNDFVIDITKWAQEYLQNPLSVNTICRAICRCQLKLYHVKKALSCPVGQGSFKMDCFKVEKCSMVRRVQIWHSCWKSRTLHPPG